MQSLTFISPDHDDPGPVTSGCRSGWRLREWKGIADVVHGFADGVIELRRRPGRTVPDSATLSAPLVRCGLQADRPTTGCLQKMSHHETNLLHPSIITVRPGRNHRRVWAPGQTHVQAGTAGSEIPSSRSLGATDWCGAFGTYAVGESALRPWISVASMSIGRFQGHKTLCLMRSRMKCGTPARRLPRRMRLR